ncbi:MAG: hypothetical protein OEZ65_17085 [Gemmatimonadota bacterium]|nr:hypothetical protein [Gemmatimonadota bacterium]
MMGPHDQHTIDVGISCASSDKGVVAKATELLWNAGVTAAQVGLPPPRIVDRHVLTPYSTATARYRLWVVLSTRAYLQEVWDPEHARIVRARTRDLGSASVLIMRLDDTRLPGLVHVCPLVSVKREDTKRVAGIIQRTAVRDAEMRNRERYMEYLEFRDHAWDKQYCNGCGGGRWGLDNVYLCASCGTVLCVYCANRLADELGDHQCRCGGRMV